MRVLEVFGLKAPRGQYGVLGLEAHVLGLEYQVLGPGLGDQVLGLGFTSESVS